MRKAGVVTANMLNIRKKPGVSKDNPSIESLNYNDKVTIYDTTEINGSTWYMIGENQWVHGGWIKIINQESSANITKTIEVPKNCKEITITIKFDS